MMERWTCERAKKENLLFIFLYQNTASNLTLLSIRTVSASNYPAQATDEALLWLAALAYWLKLLAWLCGSTLFLLNPQKGTNFVISNCAIIQPHFIEANLIKCHLDRQTVSEQSQQLLYKLSIY